MGGVLLAVLAIPAVIGEGATIGFKVAIMTGLGLNYPLMFGPQASLCSAQFPPEPRYSGLSLGIQLAAAPGGGLVPIIATALMKTLGGLISVVYILQRLGFCKALRLAYAGAPRASRRQISS